jgi:DNA ligase-4
MTDDTCNVKFIKLCKFLERLSSTRGRRKSELLQDFFQKSDVKNFFPIARLMVPTYDIERGQYGLKERVLGKMYADILNLPTNEKEALINFKNPRKQLVGWAAGDFVTVLNQVLRNRAGASKGLVITDINAYLDKLATEIDRAGKTHILRELLQNTNALEQSWLARIILKDLKIGTHEKILSCFHPKAQELFYNTNNLREVFSKLRDPNAEIGTTLFQLH